MGKHFLAILCSCSSDEVNSSPRARVGRVASIAYSWPSLLGQKCTQSWNYWWSKVRDRISFLFHLETGTPPGGGHLRYLKVEQAKAELRDGVGEGGPNET